jgi:hypothetical protein
MNRTDAHPHPVRVIAGSGRSGTTWVQDVIADANALRPLFEPLHPLAIPQARPFAYRYFRPDEDDPAAREFLSGVFDGRFHTWWTDYRVRPDRLVPTLPMLRSARAFHDYVRRWRKLWTHRKRYGPKLSRQALLVKFIRANLMLGWIQRHFDARIVLVLRHPGAVIESRLRLGGEDWDASDQLRQYTGQSALHADYLFKYNDVLRGSLTAAESHAAIWCIENQLPLTQLGAGTVTVAFYEQLLSGQPEPWQSIIDALELRQMPDERRIQSPSQSTAGSHRGTFEAADGRRWQERLPETVRREIAAILHAMEVEVYDMDDPMPRPAALSGYRAPPTFQEKR